MAARGLPQAEVLLGPLRAAYARSGVSANEIARRTGWHESYVRRCLREGASTWKYHVRADGTRRAYRTEALSVSYENAVRLAEAMGVDPVDVGL